MTPARRTMLAAAFASLTIATAAHADVAPVAPRRVVVVHVRGTPDEVASLEATMRELLGRLELTMATGSAPPSSVLETVTVDLGSSVGAKVIVTSAAGAIVINRIVRGETPAIQREQIAHAVRGAAEAELLVDADRVAGRAPPVVEEPPPPLPEPTPAPAPAPAPPEPPPIVVERPASHPVAEQPTEQPRSGGIALDLSTFAGGGGFADDTSVVARVGGSIGIAGRSGLRPSLALAALYAFPFDSGESFIITRSHLFSLRLLPGITVIRAGWFSLETAVGPGFDVVTVEPVSNIFLLDAWLNGSTTRVSPIITGAVTGRASIASDMSLSLTAVLDVDPLARNYVFDSQGTRFDIFQPWSFRPMLLAGISFSALGGGR